MFHFIHHFSAEYRKSHVTIFALFFVAVKQFYDISVEVLFDYRNIWLLFAINNL